MELDDYRWLASESAKPWLDLVRTDDRPTLQLATVLRKDLSAARAHLVLEQCELRRRAAEKFPQAKQMFFTRKALEQATDYWLARHKAKRFPAGSRVADLCCGIGGDLAALADHGPVVGVDRDPIVALLAEANARALGFSTRIQVVASEIESIDLHSFDAWHIDPDRRPQGLKRTHLAGLEPDGDVLQALLKTNECAAWKLAPATELPEELHSRSELEWISRDGECRQLVAWFGRLADRKHPRTATVLSRDGEVLRVVCGEPGFPDPGTVRRFVFEPDAAILAARLAGQVASEYGLHALGPAGYLTGDEMISDGGLAAFEVIEAMPFDRKRLAAWLAERGIGRVEVKKRGTAVEPDRLVQQLRGSGQDRATVMVTPAGGTTLAIVARRVARAGLRLI